MLRVSRGSRTNPVSSVEWCGAAKNHQPGLDRPELLAGSVRGRCSQCQNLLVWFSTSFNPGHASVHLPDGSVCEVFLLLHDITEIFDFSLSLCAPTESRRVIIDTDKRYWSCGPVSLNGPNLAASPGVASLVNWFRQMCRLRQVIQMLMKSFCLSLASHLLSGCRPAQDSGVHNTLR